MRKVSHSTAGNVNVYTIPSSVTGDISVSNVSNTANVYIEGERASGSIMRVVVQDGENAPNITVIKFL